MVEITTRATLRFAGISLIGLLLVYILISDVNTWKDGTLKRSNQSVCPAPSQPLPQEFPSFFEDPCNEIPLSSPTEFFRYMRAYTIPCRKKIMYGGQMMGNVLDGERFVCQDPPYTLAGPNCNVFSFGIHNEWSFDDEMDRLGCKVYAFDPTMGVASHDRSANIKFYSIGVHGEDGTIKIYGKDADVLTYKSIAKLTETENKTIDFFKMDVEGAEIPFFDEAFKTAPHLLKKIKQIGIEIHFLEAIYTPRMADYWRHFQKLECLGFRLIDLQFNRLRYRIYQGLEYSCCYDLVWLMDPAKAHWP